MKGLPLSELVAAAAHSQVRQLPIKLEESANGAVHSGDLSGGMVEQEGLEAYEKGIEGANDGLGTEGQGCEPEEEEGDGEVHEC